MIKHELVKAINNQINVELSASYTYLAMSAYFESKNLTGFARWMKLQSEEETMHADRLYAYLLDRGGKIELEGIAKPVQEFQTSLEVFKLALELEQKNTDAINALYALATKLNDYATKSHLQWFLDEQVEEEKSIEEIIALLEMAGTDMSAILLLNDKLGARKPESSGPADG